MHKKANIYLDKKEGEKVKKGESICTLYSENVYNLKQGKKTAQQFQIFDLNE